MAMGHNEPSDPPPAVARPQDGPARTAGQLPLEPFRHQRPTTIGLLDLDVSAVAVLPGEAGRAGDATPVQAVDGRAAKPRDAMLLVRLHGEPLGILYVDRPLGELGAEALSELVWTRLATTIRRHISQAGCTTLPDSGRDLGRLSAETTTCRLDMAGQPSGSVAVIVPTVGRGHELRRCLAMLADLPGPDYEVIVVDNRPGFGETRAIVGEASSRAEHPITYLEESRPGSSAARNRGAAQSNAEILVFTDDDVVVDRDWLRWLVAPFACAEVGATTGLVLPLELETPAQKLFELYSGFSLGLDRRSYDLGPNRADNRLLYPFWGGMFGSGASMAFRRSSFVAGGGFDPALGTGQDIDALSAAVLRGERLVYQPRSICWHANHRDGAALRRQLFNYGAGFTAVLTKAATHDRRFGGAVLRSLPVARDLYRRRRSQTPDSRPTLPRELARLERLGMVWGPLRYAIGLSRSRRIARTVAR